MTNEVYELMPIPEGWRYTIDDCVETWECQNCGTLKIFSLHASLETTIEELTIHREQECKSFKVIKYSALKWFGPGMLPAHLNSS